MATTGPSSSRVSPTTNEYPASDQVNGHGATQDTHPRFPNPAAKKGKNRKLLDPNLTSKLVVAKLNQLELDVAGEKDLDLEIDREVKKATRDLNNLLAGMSTPMERVDALQRKNAELLADMKRMERDYVKSKKRADQLQKEKDSQRADLSKALGMREKLEKLSRDLAREVKKTKDEHRKLEDCQKKIREALTDRAESLHWDLDDIMEQKESVELQKINMEADQLFRHKFKSLIDHYELREEHIRAAIRTKQADVQFNLARYESQRKIAQNEAARCKALSKQVATFSQTENELRNQLNIYVEKFKQVEDTLNNSNDLFLTFRKEMEDMSKKTKRFEKENLQVTRKLDLCNRNILEMAEERAKVNQEVEILRRQKATLESVIRKMQDQGRGLPPGSEADAVAGMLDGGGEDEDNDDDDEDDDGTESEYDEEYDEEGSDDEEEYLQDYDTEEDQIALRTAPISLPTFGPVLPPPSATVAHSTINGLVAETNGVTH